MERFKDYEQLPKYITNSYIRAQKHPTLPLHIYNYTQKTQFENAWDDITKKCRGLVLDDKGKVVIDSIPKFFNLHEPQAPDLLLENCLFLEKLDGYYIAIKKDSRYGLIITSRGSFDNKYVSAAKKLITPKILKELKPDYTYFCELCQNFPGDEGIIVMKHPIPRLVCWAIKKPDFQEIPPDISPFDLPAQWTLGKVKQIMETPSKLEGAVAVEPQTFKRVKIKTDWYLRTHRIISDCTPSRVYELFSNHERVESLDIPDEFMPQMLKWQEQLETEVERRWQHIQEVFSKTENWSDKELGLSDKFVAEKPYLFLLRKDQTQVALDLIVKNLKGYLLSK